MTTPVIVTNYSQTIEFDFNTDGEVIAVINQIRTIIQNPDTMEIIAGHISREPMTLEDAKNIIASSQMQPNEN